MHFDLTATGGVSYPSWFMHGGKISTVWPSAQLACGEHTQHTQKTEQETGPNRRYNQLFNKAPDSTSQNLTDFCYCRHLIQLF